MISSLKNKNTNCKEYYDKYKTCLYIHSIEGVHTFFECDKEGQEYYRCLRFIEKYKKDIKHINK